MTMVANNNGKTKAEQCTWTTADEATLVYAVQAAKFDRLQSENGWKPTVWPLLAKALLKSGSKGPTKNNQVCGVRWTRVSFSFDFVGLEWDGDSDELR